MDPLESLPLYQPVRRQLEVFAVDDDGSWTDVWKESNNLSWRRQALSPPGFAPPGIPLTGAFFDPQERLSVFAVAPLQGAANRSQGVVHCLTKIGNDPWNGPKAIGPGAASFDVGTPLAAAFYPPHGTLEVLAASHDGAVWVQWMTATDPWRAQQIAARTFAAPGQPLAMAYYRDHGTLESLVVDTNGAVHVLWKSSTAGWQHVPITGNGLAGATIRTRIALAYYDGYGQLEGFLVDGQGRVVVLWKTASTPWQWVPLTTPGFAPAGAPIAAVDNAPHGQLEVFVVGNDGALWLFWKTNNSPWNPPIRLSEAGTFAPKAPVAAAHFPPTDQLEAFVGDRLHLAREVTKYENRTWRPCALPIAPRKGILALPDVQTSRLMQVTGTSAMASKGMTAVDLGANTTHQGTHFVFFGDVPRGDRNVGPGQDADAVAYVSFMDQGGIQLELITGADGLFSPFVAKFAPGAMGAAPGQSRVTELGNSQTPTGAFSYGEFVYVFALVAETPGQPWPSPTAYLFRSRNPFDGQPYEQVIRFSEGKFWQAAPWVVPSLPELPPHSGDGVVVLGLGFHDPVVDAAYLAWMPLTPDGPAFDQVRYYAGPGSYPWLASEASAVPLWLKPGGYSSISLAHIDGASRWVALYSRANTGPQYRERSPVVARVGRTLVDWSDEIVVFDPCRDGAYGNFMHWPDLDALHLGGIPNDDVPAWAYGPFLIAPLTRWHPAENEVTIHYLMSTHRPYQVQLMRSRFRIP